MRDECIKAVTQAAGRSLSQEDIKGIEDRIAAAQRELARKDRAAYMALSPESRLRQAGKLAAQQLDIEAGKARQRVGLTIAAHDRIEGHIERMKAEGFSDIDAFDRLLAFSPDRKSDVQSIETRTHAIAADSMRQLVSTLDLTAPKAFGLFANRDGVRAFVHALFDTDAPGIPAEVAGLARQAAKAWTDISGQMRQAFNDAGGDVGKLEDWHMPQRHAGRLVAKAGREKWVADIFPKLKRDAYVNADGTFMDDAQIVGMLGEAWTTIATGGANSMEPGKITGRGMLANAHKAERSLHFKDAQGYLDYQEKYGGIDVYTTMMEHIQSMAKDIAAVETLGPNPDLAARYWIDKGTKTAKLADPKSSEKIDAKAQRTRDLYDFMAGKTKPVANRAIAYGFDTLRNWMVATKLGSAALTSLTDNATMHLTAAINNMPAMQLMRNQLQTLDLSNKNELQMARLAGLSLRTYMGEMNRWGQVALGPSFSSKMANLTIRLSGLNAMTEARRRAFGVTMYGSIGRAVLAAKDAAHLAPEDRVLLLNKGVTEADFAVWKLAKLQDWGDGNNTMLTPDAVYAVPDADLAGMGDPATLRREAALKLLGMVDEETNMAVIEPGARDRSVTSGGFQRGTLRGEIARSVFLFKGFPLAMISRHWVRGMNMNTAGGKAAYIGAFMAGGTLIGAAVQQIKEIVNGRDPRDMSNGTFWAASALNGGSLGLYGDFLFSDTTRFGNTPIGTLAGPALSTVEDFISLTQGSVARLAKGQDTNFLPKAATVLKNNIPLQNLWYTKAVTDRIWAQNVMEMISPGYVARIEGRAKSQFNQSYWWKLDEPLPERPPEIPSN